jgi:hypothetical protein
MPWVGLGVSTGWFEHFNHLDLTLMPYFPALCLACFMSAPDALCIGIYNEQFTTSR